MKKSTVGGERRQSSACQAEGIKKVISNCEGKTYYQNYHHQMFGSRAEVTWNTNAHPVYSISSIA